MEHRVRIELIEIEWEAGTSGDERATKVNVLLRLRFGANPA